MPLYFGYPLKTSKASSAIALQQILTKINPRLKLAKLGVRVQLLRVQRQGACLSLVATLPPKPDSTQTKRYQQRIALKLLANPQGLKQAEAEVQLLRARLAAREFDWPQYIEHEPTTVPGTTCQEWMARFKSHIIATNCDKFCR
jgi:hypothetical protein